MSCLHGNVRVRHSDDSESKNRASLHACVRVHRYLFCGGTVFVLYAFVLFFLPCREQRARMDVDEPTAKAVGGEILPMIFVVSKAIEYIKNQILDRVVSECW